MRRIQTKGLGQHDHDVMLGKCNLITGANGSGKTKLAEAVRILALGWSPTFGKRPVDTAEAMRGDRLEVVCELGDGRTITRTVRASGKGYSSDCQVSWLDARKSGSDEHRTAALELFGSSEAEVAEVLNVRSLTHATEGQRAKRIQELLESSFDVKRALRAFGRYVMLRLASRVDDPPEDHRSLRPAVQGYREDGEHTGQYALLRAIVPKVEQSLKTLGVAGAITWAKEHRLAAQAETRRLGAAMQVAEERAQELPLASAQEIAELERKREDLDRAIGGVEERLVDVRRAAQRVEEARRLVARKESDLATAEQNRAAFDEESDGDDAARITEIEAEIEEIKDLARSEPVPDTSVEEAEQARIASQLAELPAAAEPNLDALRRRVTELEKPRALSPWDHVRQLAEGLNSAVDNTKGNPVLRSTVIGAVAELRRLASEHGGAGADGGELDAARAALSEAEALHDAWEEASSARAALAAQADEAERAIHARRVEHSRRLAERGAAIHALVEERDAIRSRVADRGARDVATRAAVERAADDVKAAKRRLAEIRGDGHDDAEALEGQRSPMVAQLSEVRARLATLSAARAKRDEIDRMRLQLLRAEDEQTVYGSAEWALVQVRADEINESGGRLARTMREFLNAAGREETPIIQADVLGWALPGGSPIPVKALSDGEFCLFSTAFTAALLIAQAPEERILLVEADVASDETLDQLIAGIEAVVSELTTVIVSRWATPREIPAGWSAIEFSADGSVREAA